MDRLLLILIGLLVVFIAFFIFAMLWKKPLDTKKVQIKEQFNQYNEHFDGAEPTKSAVLKLFYVDWCGHCKNFKPVFQGELSDMVNREGVPCKLESINCDENKEAAQKYNIQGFPTLIYEGPNNDIIEYQGDRSARSIVDFIKQQLGK